MYNYNMAAWQSNFQTPHVHSPDTLPGEIFAFPKLHRKLLTYCNKYFERKQTLFHLDEIAYPTARDMDASYCKHQ